ncbi:hypothetical protein T01_11257 [Trichinella spiralis]|uniref:Uncharacterized protein n=2 Tax=Trichinella spiralis TaxID=6334 RepID=A0A0V1B281_TRISP|nr:hypothetical protein T01_11257 [Trichinella spiralis]
MQTIRKMIFATCTCQLKLCKVLLLGHADCRLLQKPKTHNLPSRAGANDRSVEADFLRETFPQRYDRTKLPRLWKNSAENCQFPLPDLTKANPQMDPSVEFHELDLWSGFRKWCEFWATSRHERTEHGHL